MTVTKKDKDIVERELKKIMNKIRKEWMKDSKSDPFADVKIYRSKKMDYIHNSDESKGWTGTMSVIKQKEPNSNVVLLVTYDGAGYDFFSINSEFPDMNWGEGTATAMLRNVLNEKYNNKYGIEHANNWAFEVYKEED